jgi:MFS transporter, PPP family, 3-phenylpropionic acid transporter
MQVGFAVLRCTAAGIGATTAGLLWAESVAVEVAVFLLGPYLLRSLWPATASALSA